MGTRFRFLLLLVALGTVVNQIAADEPAAKAKKAKKAKAEPRVLDPFDRPEGSIVDQTARYYVWYDKQGWHLRTTAKVGRNFSGTIRVKDAKIKSCVPVGLKDRQKVGDAWQVNEARSELRFAFKTSKLSDGFDLVVEGDEGQMEFELAIDNQRNPRAVFVGKSQQHPDQNPFTLPAAPKKTM
jgi:hypothetical protein